MVVADEVRNYLFGKDPAQFDCYRKWALETGGPALKGLLPHVGGDVSGGVLGGHRQLPCRGNRRLPAPGLHPHERYMGDPLAEQGSA